MYKLNKFEIRIFNKKKYLVKEDDFFQYELSENGAEILYLIIDGIDIEDIIKMLSLKYDVDIKTLKKDVNLFLSDLLKYDILLNE